MGADLNCLSCFIQSKSRRAHASAKLCLGSHRNIPKGIFPPSEKNISFGRGQMAARHDYYVKFLENPRPVFENREAMCKKSGILLTDELKLYTNSILHLISLTF